MNPESLESENNKIDASGFMETFEFSRKFSYTGLFQKCADI